MYKSQVIKVTRRKRSGNSDPFGFGSGGFDFGLGNFSKSYTLANNRMRGRMAEDSFALEHRLRGHDVKKIHKGGDFVVQKRDFFGNKIGKPTVHEIKTGNAKLSDAQRRKKARLGNRRYKVERY
jgi:hypothetical protein